MNSITIGLTLGRDPETKMTQTGKEMVTSAGAFSAGRDKPTQWFDLTAWAGSGFAADRLREGRKGDLVIVSGYLTVREYDGKTYLGITVQDCEFAQRRRVQEQRAPQGRHDGPRDPAPPRQQAPQQQPPEDDDLVPF